MIEPILALVVGALLTALAAAFGRHERNWDWSVFLAFFVIVFLSSWAGGLWIEPFGTSIFEVYWLPFLIAGLLAALLLLAFAPRRPPGDRAAKAEEAGVVTILGFTFWMILLLLAMAIATGY